ncbi:MAG: extracellular solute-binding protein [Lachnospiraceae bacterium]
MKLRKLIGLVLVATVCFGSLIGCTSSAQANNKTFTVWASGSDNVKVQLEAQITNFNSIQSDYTAKLEFITSGTGAQGLTDRIIAAKLAGQENTDYDVVELGGDTIAGLKAQGGDDILLEIDYSKLPNAENLQAKNTVAKEVLVPYRGTTVGFAYDSTRVSSFPKTEEELHQWIKENPGRFAYNTPDSGGAGSAFVVTTIYNLMPEEALTSNDEAWTSSWDEGFAVLKELHPYMYTSSGKVIYPNKNQGTIDLLASQEVDIIPAWADQIITQIKAGTLPETVQFVQIDPSLTGNTAGFAIPSIGSNSEGALAWINYMLSSEAQNIALDLQAAIPVIDFSLLDQELISTIDGLDVSAFRLSSLGELSSKLNEKWDAEIATLD